MTRWRVSSTDDAALVSQSVALADDDADQSFVRGNDQLDALKDLIDAISAFANALATAAPAAPNGALTVAAVAGAFATLEPQPQAAKAALEQALSVRIKGE